MSVSVSGEHKKQHAELIKQGLDGLFAQLSSYLSADECARIRVAFVFADGAHLGQYRQSGEPYITHPLAVATLCATWKLDSQSIKAALLHDVMEDSGVDKIALATQFGAPVANLVDGLSKLDKLSFDSKEAQQAESFRKMLLAMAEDVRVILIKLADRLHNMRTLQFVKPEKRERISRETLEVYAPLGRSIGIHSIASELEELAFTHLNPTAKTAIERRLEALKLEHGHAIEGVSDEVERVLSEAGVPARVFGRQKTPYSIWRKMERKAEAKVTPARALTCT